jgi:prepilin-type N-terminal cleavage/methylation domain-containing protein
MKGYTLIEILVGLTIIGLLFGFGFVSFRDYSRRQALAGAAKQIQGDLRLAQEDALAGQKPDSSFCNDPASLNGYDFAVVSTSEYKLEADCTGGLVTQKDVVLPADTSIASDVNPILFKILGQGTSLGSGQSATITLAQTGTNNQATVTVSSGGEIQ